VPLNANEDDPAAYYRSTRAVIVGIDAYPGRDSGLAPLRFAVNDAAALRDILVSEFGYPPEHVLKAGRRFDSVAALGHALGAPGMGQARGLQW
jgi:hypothetical protein